MTDPELPSVLVKPKRGISIIWIIPIVAALVAGWIWWRAAHERGPTIAIRFETAEGIEAGKTQVKFKDVTVGMVQGVELNPDLSGVTVTASMTRDAEPHLVDSTRFWVVRPRIGAGGVQGLGTLVSGAYVSMDPGTEGEPRRVFTGLELPPVAPADAPGLKITLVSDALGGLDVGSPVYFRQIRVGQVERHRLTDDSRRVEVDLYVEPGFDDLVRANTRFWNAGGIDVQMGAEGLQVSVQALASVLAGGIAFATPEPPGPPAQQGEVFPLYEDERSAREVFETTAEYVLYFEESLRGLQVGAPVEHRGIQVGHVTAMNLVFDPATGAFRIPVTIALQRGRIAILGEVMADKREDNRDELVEAGMRARLETANLLTGALFIDLGFHSDVEPVWRGPADGALLELPTIPSTSAQIGETLRRLPLIVEDLQRTAHEVADVVTGEQVGAAIANVVELTGELQHLSERLGEGLPPLLAELRELSVSADAALADLSDQAAGARGEVSLALSELAGALRSVRVLADYLERHPEALLTGKQGDP